MHTNIAADVAPLLDEILEAVVSMPVRPMERLMALGGDAVPPLLDALADAIGRPDDHGPPAETLWLVVLLGELRDPRAVDPLLALVKEDGPEFLRLAAAEALAKIGEPAVPGVIGLAREGAGLTRILAYACLGWIRQPRTREELLDALERDPDHTDDITQALREHGHTDDIPALYRALERCHPWQRVEVEDAIRGLYHGDAEPLPPARDWRVHYRPPHRWGLRSWALLSHIVREHGTSRRRRPRPVRPLDEILADTAAGPLDERICPECGGPVERPTGLPVCREDAVDIVRHQVSWLEAAVEQGIEDVFEWLGELERGELEILDLAMRAEAERKRRRRPGGRAKGSRAARDIPPPPVLEHRQEKLQVQQETAVWLVEQGIEDTRRGVARLRAIERRLVEQWGDPAEEAPELDLGSGDDARGDDARPAAAPPRAGRNEPCPCGSGRKYKKCCGRDAAAAAAPAPQAARGRRGPGAVAPTFVNFDNELVVAARAMYRMADTAAVLAALRGAAVEPRPQETFDLPLRAPAVGGPLELHMDDHEDPPLFTVARPLDEGGYRGIATIQLGERLVVETMSRERLARARRFLEEIAGAWLHHEADSFQDLHEAMDEARDRPSPPKPDIPIEIQRKVIGGHMDRHYRAWLDDSIPALEGMTPRQAALEPAMRGRLEELVRGIERMEEHRLREDGWAWDASWIRRELGMA